jgi:hypothetical protein
MHFGCNGPAKQICCAGFTTKRSATADVQALVEISIQLLLLGIECRQLLLLVLFQRRVRRKRLGAWLQMADRRLRHRAHCSPWERVGIPGCIAQNQGAAE